MSDSRAELAAFDGRVEEAAARVLASGWFVLGAEVDAFEREFAAYLGVSHAIGVGSGTDALHLSLRALDLEPGTEVITVPNTAVATVAAIEQAGARPVFVDIAGDSFLLDPDKLDAVLTSRTRAIVPVDLYGQVADFAAITAFARRHGLKVIEDACQAHGARYQGQQAGTFGDLGCFSFYPSKNLAAAGDGGLIVTDDSALADRVRLIRQYGWRGRFRDHSEVRGYNSRLDEIQAAILRVKLERLDERNAARRRLAERYAAALTTTPLILPKELDPGRSSWHLYVVRHPQRDDLRRFLNDHGIGATVHYPTPIYLQPAYRDLGLGLGTCPIAEQVQREILSLPLYPELTDEAQDQVISTIQEFFAKR